jgi:Beta-galactosidase
MTPTRRTFVRLRAAALAAVLSVALAAAAAVATAGSSKSPQIVVRSPAEVSTAFRNPGMGWLIYSFQPVQRPGAAQTTPLASTVYSNYFTWADLEPVEGHYRWDLIDRFLRAWPGRQVRLGIRMTGPVRLFGAAPLPGWLRKRIDGGYYTSPSTWEPRYTNPVFLQQHAAFLSALAHRYYDTPRGGVDWRRRIESFDIDSYGMWGEWWSKYDFDDRGITFSPSLSAGTANAPVAFTFADVLVRQPDGTVLRRESSATTAARKLVVQRAGTSGRIAYATAIGRDVDVAVGVTADRLPVHGNLVVDVSARDGTTGELRTSYFGRLTVTPTGAIRLEAHKRIGDATPRIGASAAVRGVTFAPGTAYRVRLLVAGSNPTTIELKAWPAWSPEPAGWQVSVEDGDPALQTPQVRPGLRYGTLKRLVDDYFDAFSGRPRPELTMNVIGSSFYKPGLDAGDPAAVRYAIDRGATMVRRGIGMPLPADETGFIRRHLDSRSLETEWVSPTGVIAWVRPLNPSVRWMATWQAVDQALSLGANYLGWYVDSQSVRCDQIPRDLPVAELPEMRECGVNGATSVTAHPLAKFYPGTRETLEDYFQRRAGYRFYVSRFAYPASVAVGGAFELDQVWWQRGVGKLYDRYYLRARLVGRATVPLNVDGGLDADRWPAGPSGPHPVGSRFLVPAGTAPGSYRLEFAVVDAGGSPAINLADGGKDTSGLGDPRNDYGWYDVGPITITR